MGLTINGVAIKPKDGSLRISDEINAKSTATFTVVDRQRAYSIENGQEVIITDGATRIFGGIIDRRVKKSPHATDSGTRILFYEVTCKDFNSILDRGKKLAETYVNTTVSDIINDTDNDRTIGAILASENITVGAISGGSVVIKQAVFNYISVTDALNYIKDVTGLNWNIDYNKELTLFYNEDNTGSSYNDSQVLDMYIDEEYKEYRNSQIIRAGSDITDEQDELPTPAPDGTSRQFLFDFPLARKPKLYINTGGGEVQVTPSDIGILGLDTGLKWYWQKNNRGVFQDQAETLLAAGNTIRGEYFGLVPIVVQSDNPSQQTARQAIEGGTGVYEFVTDLKEIDDRSAALSYAEGQLTKYADIPMHVYITSRSLRQAGQLINIQSDALDITGNYLIERATISQDRCVDGDSYIYTYKCASGESLGSWVEFFRSIKNAGQDFVIRENEILVLLVNINETVQNDSDYTIQVTNALYPAEDLFPSDTLYPNTAVLEEVTVND